MGGAGAAVGRRGGGGELEQRRAQEGLGNGGELGASEGVGRGEGEEERGD